MDKILDKVCYMLNINNPRIMKFKYNTVFHTIYGPIIFTPSTRVASIYVSSKYQIEQFRKKHPDTFIYNLLSIVSLPLSIDNAKDTCVMCRELQLYNNSMIDAHTYPLHVNTPIHTNTCWIGRLKDHTKVLPVDHDCHNQLVSTVRKDYPIVALKDDTLHHYSQYITNPLLLPNMHLWVYIGKYPIDNYGDYRILISNSTDDSERHYVRTPLYVTYIGFKNITEARIHLQQYVVTNQVFPHDFKSFYDVVICTA